MRRFLLAAAGMSLLGLSILMAVKSWRDDVPIVATITAPLLTHPVPGEAVPLPRPDPRKEALGIIAAGDGIVTFEMDLPPPESIIVEKEPQGIVIDRFIPERWTKPKAQRDRERLEAMFKRGNVHCRNVRWAVKNFDKVTLATLAAKHKVTAEQVAKAKKCFDAKP